MGRKKAELALVQFTLFVHLHPAHPTQALLSLVGMDTDISQDRCDGTEEALEGTVEASSLIQSTASNTVSQKKMPELPIELIDRILGLAFLRSAPDTPSSDHYPLRNTTHLLLVSHSFRQRALPFFLQSITITRPEDYITFFHPDGGIFAGDAGAQKWKFVREVSIVRGVHLPIRRPYAEGFSLTGPLAVPPGHQIRQFCFLNQDAESAVDDDRDGWVRATGSGSAEIVAARRDDRTYVRNAYAAKRRDYDEVYGEWDEWTEEPWKDWYDYLEEFAKVPAEAWKPGPGQTAANAPNEYLKLEEDAIDDQLLDDAYYQCIDERHTFIDALLHASSPAVFHEEFPTSLRLPRRRTEGGTDSSGGLKEGSMYAQYHNSHTPSRQQPGTESWYYETELVTGQLGIHHVHLVRYPPHKVKNLVYSLQRSDHPGIKRWTWEAEEDGQTYELDMTDFTTKVVDLI